MIEAFANAIRDPEATLPSDVINTGSRFDIYRSNYFSRLTEVLGEVFPVAKKLVGPDFFNALAKEYATRFPPVSPLLAQYGKGFADFLENFKPVRQIPYLPDMARLEWARSVAQSKIVLPSDLISTEDDILQALHLPVKYTPGATLLKSPYPIGTIWTHHQQEEPDPVPYWNDETIAVWSANSELHQVIISDQEQKSLCALTEGTPFMNYLQKMDDEQQITLMIGTFVTYINLGFLSVGDPENGELAT